MVRPVFVILAMLAGAFVLAIIVPMGPRRLHRPSVEELEATYASGDVEQRAHVFWFFTEQSPEGRALVAKGLRDPAPEVRAWAALVLHSWDPDDASAIRDLVWGLEHDRCPDLFLEALLALGPKAPPAVESIVRRMQAGDLVAADCAKALVRIEGPSPRVLAALRRMLHGDEPWPAMRVIEAIGPPARSLADDLRRFFPSESYTDMFRASDALTAVLGSPRTSIDLFLASLDHESAQVRKDCAWGLARIGPPAAIALPRLLKLADDPSDKVRAKVACALGAIAPKSPDARAALQVLRNDSSERVRKRARAAWRTVEARG